MAPNRQKKTPRRPSLNRDTTTLKYLAQAPSHHRNGDGGTSGDQSPAMLY
jgi:hypothetical protein